MLTGIKFRANPSANQKRVLSQWMGCARSIWNAKVDEERYYRTFARKYYPVGTYAPIDTKAAQFKSKGLTPWLYQCPSQIIRNSATNWYQTYQKFMRGACGRPKRKSKTDRGSIYLTREVFRFDRCEDGNQRLFIGTKTNNIGYLSVKVHKGFEVPNSLYIRRERGRYYVSFCYDNGVDDSKLLSNEQHLQHLHGATQEYLEKYVVGIDRGVAIPAHAGYKDFDFTDNQKKSLTKSERYIKRLQRKLARQVKGSARRHKTKHRISVYHGKMGNIRDDYCHKTSRTLVNSDHKVFVFEDLKTKSMTGKPKAQTDDSGRFLPNKAKAKAGLNKAILSAGWHRLENYTQYKARNAGKVVFKVSAAYTSQECANCNHTHPDNRQTQEHFECVNCGHIDNADRNASRVISHRAIKLIQDSGTELAGKGVPRLVTGRGSASKTVKRKRLIARTREASKKKSLAA